MYYKLQLQCLVLLLLAKLYSTETGISNDTKVYEAPHNCDELTNVDKRSDIYIIQPYFAQKPFPIFCEFETNGGGWAIILNRFDGSKNFDLNYQDYVQGFGNLADDFWLGLEKIYTLTGFQANELLIEMSDWEDQAVYAYYETFSLGSVQEGYPIRALKGYSGNAGDSLSYHAGCKFSTKDYDQDNNPTKNCASEFGAGWWFNDCRQSLLTGQYSKGYVNSTEAFKVMHWESFRGPGYSLKSATMMIRPRRFTEN